MRVDVHLDGTRAAVECRGGPGYSASTINLHVDVQRHIKHPVITTNRERRGLGLGLPVCINNQRFELKVAWNVFHLSFLFQYGRQNVLKVTSVASYSTLTLICWQTYMPT